VNLGQFDCLSALIARHRILFTLSGLNTTCRHPANSACLSKAAAQLECSKINAKEAFIPQLFYYRRVRTTQPGPDNFRSTTTLESGNHFTQHIRQACVQLIRTLTTWHCPQSAAAADRRPRSN